MRMLVGALALATAAPLHAQQRTTSLDTLIATSLSDHPALRAAAAQLDAARARVRPAGALPDPMLMAGIENLPLGGEADMMTMKMLGVSQLVPFPGKLTARRRAAEQQVHAAQARLDEMRNRVVRETSHVYFELAYVERALQITRATHALNKNIERAAEARYIGGTGEQRAVLDARVATAEIAEQAVTLEEQRRVQLALLAAAAGDSVERSIVTATLPARITRATAAVTSGAVRFVSAELGARAAGSPLPALRELQELAARNNPMLRARRAQIAALAYELAAERRDYLPDFDVSVRYGQRNNRPDMISATVAIPVPIRKGAKQDQMVRAAEAEHASAHAELLDVSNRVRAEVAQLHADLERIRAQLALFSKSILPQAEAAVASATGSLEAGRIELFSVLERQTDLLEYQLAFERLLTDFAQKVAQLESVVGAEVLP